MTRLLHDPPLACMIHYRLDLVQKDLSMFIWNGVDATYTQMKPLICPMTDSFNTRVPSHFQH